MNYRIWETQFVGSHKTLWSQIKPTLEQLEIATRLGIQVSPGDSFGAVASAILEKVGNTMGCPPRDVSDRQLELADELGIDISDCNSFAVAFVRIHEAIQIANLDAVQRMGLRLGDTVVKTGDHSNKGLKEALGERWESVADRFPREFEVSSIREDGQVFFKGGSGQAPARYLEKRITPE